MTQPQLELAPPLEVGERERAPPTQMLAAFASG